MTPLVSVIIPVFNRLELLPKVLESVLAQSHPHVEVIVVDDGSNPAVRLPAHDRVRLVRQENRGAPAARNRGFAESKGEYVIFWDADVVGRPDMIAKMVEALENAPSASFAYSDFNFGRKRMPAGPFSPERLRQVNYITTTSLIRRSDFPGFDESLRRFQDWDLWLTMLEKNKTGVYVPECLFSAISTGGTMSSWLPSFAYRAPWKWLPGVHSQVKKYNDARSKVIKKHNLQGE